MNPYKVGTVFSGHCDGFALAAEWAEMEVLWQIEINRKAHRYLKKNFPHTKKHYDVRNTGKRNLAPIDILLGGPPCQPASLAGNMRGPDDERWLWNEWFRLHEELRPAWSIAENVAGLASLPIALRADAMETEDCTEGIFDSALEVFRRDYEKIGYRTLNLNLPACAVGAPHERQRIWIVAYDDRLGFNTGDTPFEEWPQRIKERDGIRDDAHPGSAVMAVAYGSGCKSKQAQNGRKTTNAGNGSSHIPYAHNRRLEESQAE